MSAWFVWGCLGFYPLSGDSKGMYMLGSPLFEKVTIHRPSGDVVIMAHNYAPENIYIARVDINGQSISLLEPFVYHNQFNGTTTLEFWMTSQPVLL